MQTIDERKGEKEAGTPFAALFSVPVEAVDSIKDTQIQGGDDEKPTITSIAPGQE